MNLEESLEIARDLAAEGVDTVVATPHVSERWANSPAAIVAAVVRLLEELHREGIALSVATGAEVDLGWSFRLGDGVLRELCLDRRRRLLLVETPYEPLGAGFERQLFELQARGFRPLLAHPERNPTIHGDPARLVRLVERGVLVQITAGAVVAGAVSGSSSGRAAWELLRRGAVHVLASDVHHAGGRGPLTRARAVLAERHPALADWLSRECPTALLDGFDPPPRPPFRLSRRGDVLRRLAPRRKLRRQTPSG